MELLSKLGINAPALIAQAVNFLILLLILGKFVYKPVISLLEERRRRILEDKAASEKLETQLKELDVLRAKTLAEAREEGNRLIKEAAASAEGVKAKMLEAARLEIERLQAEEVKHRENERQRILAEVRQEVGELLSLAVERSFGDVIGEKEQNSMVAQALAVFKEGEKVKDHTSKTETGGV